MAIVATGGYGRGLLAPFSDIDLLFLLPYKQTPWGESVVEYMLYVLWDLGLKVGHATRTVEQCLKLARSRHHDPHRAARCAPDPRRRAALSTQLSSASARGGAAARRASSSRPRWPSATSATGAPARVRYQRRAQHQGRQGRPARPAHAALARQVPLRPRRGRGDGCGRRSSRRTKYATFRRCEDFLWTVRCHLHFLTGRAEERSDLRRAAAAWPSGSATRAAAACARSSAS